MLKWKGTRREGVWVHVLKVNRRGEVEYKPQKASTLECTPKRQKILAPQGTPLFDDEENSFVLPASVSTKKAKGCVCSCEKVGHFCVSFCYWKHQTSNEYLQEWLAGSRLIYMDELVCHEAHYGQWLCQDCRTAEDATYRCQMCFGGLIQCQQCCVHTHKKSSLHHVQKWNGCFFDRLDLNELGLVIYAGHDGDIWPAAAFYTSMWQYYYEYYYYY